MPPPPAVAVHVTPAAGPPPAAATAAVVLLHGLFGAADDWAAVAPRLPPLRLPVAAVDLPYHGGSAGTAAATVPAAAAAVAVAVAAALPAVTSVVLVGYSLGGRVALAMAAAAAAAADADAAADAAADADGAATAPRRLRVDGVLLVSAHPGIPPAEAPARRRRDAATAAAVAACADGAAFGAWLRGTWYAAGLWGSLRTDAGFDALLARRVARCVPRRVAAAVAAFSPAAAAAASPAPPSGWAWLAADGGRTPVVYMYGEEDGRYAAVARRLRALPRAPAVAVVAVPAVGHAVLAQAPAAVAAAAVRLAWRAAAPAGGGVAVAAAYARRFMVPLAAPMAVGGRRVAAREGVLLQLVATRGGQPPGGVAAAAAAGGVAGGPAADAAAPEEVAGVAEVSPLPGLHAVSLSAAVAQVAACLAHLPPAPLYPSSLVFEPHEGGPAAADRGGGGTAAAAGVHPLFARLPAAAAAALSPTVTCAVECALVQVLAAGVLPLADALAALAGVYGPIPATVAVNAVVPRSAVPSAAAAGGGRGVPSLPAGVAVVKVKVGAAAAAADAAAVAALLATLPARVRVRLDANRSWTPSEAAAFVAALAAAVGGGPAGLGRIEYVEEPLVPAAVAAGGGHGAAAAALAVADGGSLPYALDESLVGGGAATPGAAAGTPPWPAAVVLKPAVLGGLAPAARLAARWAPAAAVASTCFDSGVGVAWAALLAATLDARAAASWAGEPPPGGGGGVAGAPAHGLGTFASLAADVVAPSLAAAAWAAPRGALDVRVCAQLLADVAATTPGVAGVAAAPGDGAPPPPERPPRPPRFALSAAVVAEPTRLFPR